MKESISNKYGMVIIHLSYRHFLPMPCIHTLHCIAALICYAVFVLINIDDLRFLLNNAANHDVRFSFYLTSN